MIDPDHLADIRKDMIRFAQLQLRDAAAAEDAVQEALLAALAKPGAFAGRSEVKTWVFAILRNKIVDIIRQQARTTNVSALSAEEEDLDQTFESLFKANAHWTPESRPRNWAIRKPPCNSSTSGKCSMPASTCCPPTRRACS